MKYILFTFILISQVVHGQSVIDSSKRKTWLQSIQNNGITTAAGKNYKAANSGYALYFSQVDSLQVPYLVYVPKSYSPRNSYPLVVYLHGGVVSISEFEYKDPEFVEEPIFSVADRYNAIVLFPFGRKDFGWVKQPKAFENVLSVIQQTKRTYNIDNDKVYLGGMSNGGSATFWFISNAPDLFAGFYAFSAYPKLKVGGIEFANISGTKPLYSVHAKDDSVYMYAAVKDVYEQQKDTARGWHFETLETGGHGFIYGDNGGKIISQVMDRLLIQK